MIWIGIPGLPPTSNHAYQTLKSGRRVLAEEGRAYLAQTPAFIAQHYREELLLVRKNVPLALAFRFTFLQLQNKTWQSGTETRYKRLDVGNRLKLCEDAWKAAAGADDSQHITLALKKQEGPEELTEIWVWDLEQEVCPFDLAFSKL